MFARTLTALVALAAVPFLHVCGDEDDDDFESITGPTVEKPPPRPPVDSVFSLDPDVAPVTDGAWYRPAPDVTWQWQLAGEINTAYDVDVYDFDFEQPSSLVAALQGRGIRVICYFSAGSAESWRPEFSS